MGSKKLLDQQAYPDGRETGLTIRHMACIMLKLPLTGDRSLDRLINIAQRRDLSATILGGIMSKQFDADGETKEDSITSAIEYCESLVQHLSKQKEPATGKAA